MIAEASPGTTLEYRSRLLDSIASVDSETEARVAAERLEQLDLSKTVTQLKIDYLMRSLLDVTQLDRKTAIDGLLRLVDSLSEEEKSSFKTALQAGQSSGTLTYQYRKLSLMTFLGPPSYSNSSSS
jgi:acetyl-CoA carboxylase/biotin carboxylase 1